MELGKSTQYDDGVTPAVALNNQGLVVEVHKSQAHDTSGITWESGGEQDQLGSERPV